tara:strand:- start:28692 stop:29588 length:897 start_codon:yes stop_codon:yes gene_type:complete
MKKILTLLIFFTTLLSCSDDSENFDLLTNTSTEKNLVRIESEGYNFAGAIAGKSVINIHSGKYQSGSTYDNDNTLRETFVQKYNSDGLCISKEHYDAKGIRLEKKDFTISYDAFNRISEIKEWNCVRKFTYFINNTITELITFTDSQNTKLSLYYLNDQGKIYKNIDSNSITETVEFYFSGDRIMSATTKFGDFGTMDTDYTYDSNPPKGFSHQKIMTNTYGSATNAILFEGARLIEARAPLYYDNSHTSKIEYSSAIPGFTGRTDLLTYSIDSEGYTIQSDIYSGSTYVSKSRYIYQ